MDDIGRLIRHAGARDAVPQDRFDRSRERVQSHWEQVVADKRRLRNRSRYQYLAIAASIVVVVTVTLLLRGGEIPAPPPMAHVDRVLGDVLIDNALASAGDVVAPDAQIETTDSGRIALRLADGQSLRIDTSSLVAVHSANNVTLETGGLYVDTERNQSAAPVLVMTALGQARDVGTQFQVRLADDMLTVGVREGQVEVTRPDREAVSVDSGQLVDLNTDGSKSERDIEHDDPIWSWVETVAPDFDGEGATLERYLNWYAGQRGLQLVWADQGSEQRAKQVVLSGSIAGMSLEDGFQAVRRIAPFEFRFEDDTLWVSVE